jgi:hypothetical protein
MKSPRYLYSLGIYIGIYFCMLNANRHSQEVGGRHKMVLTDSVCHTASVAIPGKPEALFNYVADGVRLGEWAFGSWNTKESGDGIFSGKSLFDGKDTYIRVVPYLPMLQVDFEVGSTPRDLLPRITARILPPTAVEVSEGSCLLSIISWRVSGFSDQRWRMLCSAHEAEVFRLRHSFLESQLAPANSGLVRRDRQFP